MMDMEAFRVDVGEAFRVDMGDACGGPTRMDVEDGDGDNGLSDGGDQQASRDLVAHEICA